jgi:phosphoserine phosphatase RsbU/P
MSENSAVHADRHTREGATLQRELQRIKRENGLLRAIGMGGVHGLNTESLAHLIMDTLLGLIPYDAAGLYFLNPHDGTISWETLRGYDINKLHLVREKLDYGIMGWALAKREVVLLADVSMDERYFNARDRTKSELVVPIELDERVIGFFNLESDSLNSYSEDDMQLMQVFASQVARTVEYTVLREEREDRKRVKAELGVARSIQQMLFPSRPVCLPDLEIAGRNLTSREVGGDCYDHFELTDEDYGLVIADVAGKGVPASLLMTSFRSGVRLLAQHRTDITGIMSCLNDHLEEITDAEAFVTACYGVYNRLDHSLSYVNAGHNPPLLYRSASGAIVELDEGGILLGSFAKQAYELGRVDLEPGDSLLFFTDGLNEALSESGEEYGSKRIAASLSKFSELDPPELVEALLEDLRIYLKLPKDRMHFDDDLTLLVLKRMK